MLRMNWESHFSRAVLARGLAYYEAGKVSKLKENKGSYAALVSGGENYSVYIGIHDGNVSRMSCGCPFAAEGFHCKHMAAVLYAIVAQSSRGDESEQKVSGKNVSDPLGAGSARGEGTNRLASEKNEGQVHPESESAAYRYFDVRSMMAARRINSALLKEARGLIDRGGITLQEVQTGFDEFGTGQTVRVKGLGTKGENSFEVRFHANRSFIIESGCGCPSCKKFYYDWSRNCTYTTALLLLFEKYLETHRIGDATDRSSAKFLENFLSRRAKNLAANVIGGTNVLQLVPKLSETNGSLEVSFRVGEGRLFVIKNLGAFCEQVKNGELVTFGSGTSLHLKSENFTDDSKAYFEFIRRAVTMEEQQLRRNGLWSADRMTNKKWQTIGLYGELLDDFYELVKENGVEYDGPMPDGKTKGVLTCAVGNPKVELTIDQERLDTASQFHGVTVEGDLPVVYRGMDNGYFIEEGKLFRADPEFLEHLRPLQEASYHQHFKLQVGLAHLAELFYQILPEWDQFFKVQRKNTVEIGKYLPPESKYFFYLDVEDRDITCRACVRYGDTEISLLKPEEEGDSFRNTVQERELLQLLHHWFPEESLERDVLLCTRNDSAIYQLLTEGVERLLALGEVNSTDRFKRLMIVRKAKLSVGVTVESDLLNLEISTDYLSREELLEVLQSYRRKQKFHRLRNGEFLNLEDKGIEAVDEMLTMLHLSDKDFLRGKMKLPAYRALYLDKMLEEQQALYTTRDSRFRSLIKDFKAVADADYEVPDSLKNVLRNYQKEGYRWLRTLADNHFGGILADDMGLGKTVQIIAQLLAYQEEGRKGTSLVVCPASLVFNWGEEIGRFAPTLKTLLVSGSQEMRRELIADIEKYDVVVTSYDLLKRDVALYADFPFLVEVIDEAQYIKNHSTEASKAVKVIRAQTKLALTGTPIENRLSELWSIFDYLMPGFLYGYDTFRRELESPIVREQDKTGMERLRRMVSPFILRRLKEDVLKDLPEKLEEITYAKMEEPQQLLYDSQVARMVQRIEGQDAEEFKRSKIEILSELTRLRQICCDPSLCFDDFEGKSAKRAACMELVASAVEGGHKILLFSQFTSMLALLAGDLTEQGISYYCITGDTPKEKRQELVKSFNQDDTKVFLISLRAGGTGLNLTGADVVIHYDPWWNLAVQNQATDRAHRIGQTRVVTVYKLLVKNSVEEKIQKLQESKRELADRILSGDLGQITDLNQEELLYLLEG